jgi:hypothetical protein
VDVLTWAAAALLLSAAPYVNVVLAAVFPGLVIVPLPLFPPQAASMQAAAAKTNLFMV